MSICLNLASILPSSILLLFVQERLRRTLRPSHGRVPLRDGDLIVFKGSTGTRTSTSAGNGNGNGDGGSMQQKQWRQEEEEGQHSIPVTSTELIYKLVMPAV